jgi:ferredoxin/glycerol uptake facilitator-like aquaporin
MATAIKPQVKEDIVKYGAGCVDDCFNCGNCTAVCPLSKDDTPFPRKMVRYVQLGMGDKLAGAPEPWLCYYCGECSATCPREATPGETMAALRRYSIARYDVSGIAGMMYKSRGFAIVFSLLLALVLGFFLVAERFHHFAEEGHAIPGYWKVFEDVMPYITVHIIGMFVGGLMMVLVALSVINAARMMLKDKGGFGFLTKNSKHFVPALTDLVKEIAVMKRHGECATETAEQEPRHLTPRMAHLAIMWGFIMLGIATSLDFFFIYFLGIFPYIISRPLGIIGGLVMLYGLVVFTWKRMNKATPSTEETTFADWWLLFFLIVLDITGFILLAIVTFGIEGAFSEATIILHSVMAMELVLLFGMTKIGHAVFRPMALFFHLFSERAKAG